MWNYCDVFDDIDMADFVKICVVRNPIYRCISIYQYLLRLENSQNKFHPTHLTATSDFYKCKDNPVESFNLFLNHIEGGNFFDAVCQPQIKFIKDKNLKVSDIQYWFIQENLNNDFNNFCREYLLDETIRLAHNNKSDDVVKLTLTNYVDNNESVIDKISSIYHEDIDLYKRIEDIKKQ